MPFLIGLLLTPVGAAMGVVLFFAAMLLAAPHPPSARELVGMIILGLIPGSFLAAPVTVMALPLSYTLLARKSAAGLKQLAIAGAVFGFVLVWIAVLWIWWRDPVDKTDRAFWLLTLGIAADGAVAGATCGAILAAAMRRLGWHDRWRLPDKSPV